jgi:hypothetical protein
MASGLVGHSDAWTAFHSVIERAHRKAALRVLTLDQASVPRSALASVLSTEGYLAKLMVWSSANPKGYCWALQMAGQRVA